MEFAEEIREFLIESHENLSALDQQLVELEKNPADENLIASVFRTIHTLKGTSGFFGFNILGSITHIAESILGQVREKERPLTPALVSLILETVDAVKQVLTTIEATREEGEDRYQPLRERLDAALGACGEDATLTPETNEAPAVPLGTIAVASVRPEVVVAREERRNRERLANERAEAKMRELERLAMIESVPLSADLPRATELPIVMHRRRESDRRTHDSRHDDGVAHSTIRVDIALLDKLMNLVGELVLARNQILEGAARSTGGSSATQRLNLITTELQEGVMRARMQPIAMGWSMLPRVVRDLAAEMGKQIEIRMEGATTELDKTIIEAIKDPLMHIVRNACDHGIECPGARAAKGKNPQGTIYLRAFHEGGHVNIEIADDGAGIDLEKIKSKAVEAGIIRAEQAAQMSERDALRLIFLPGVSTAAKVTGLSGRGVGMDVVKTNIEAISGTVDLTNCAGMGTTIKIKIPLTLAIIPGLIVSVRSHITNAAVAAHEHRFVIPQANLLELVRLEGETGRRQIERVHDAEVYRRRGKLLPLAYLSEVLGISAGRSSATRREDGPNEDTVMNIVVVQAEETAFGLVVDDVNDTQGIVVKALGGQLKSLTCYLGATIMGDGKIALILDVVGLARMANILMQKLEVTNAEIQTADREMDSGQTLLLFRAGQFSRLAVPLPLVVRLEEVPSSRVEHAGGAPALHYRETIMPLLSLNDLLDPESFHTARDSERLQVIVFREGERYVGMVVDEIIDIVNETVTIESTRDTFGLLGSAIVGGKVTDFVDLDVLLKDALGASSARIQSALTRVAKTLLADTRIARGTMCSHSEIPEENAVGSW